MLVLSLVERTAITFTHRKNSFYFHVEMETAPPLRRGGGGGEDNKSNPGAKLRSFTMPIVLNFSIRMGFLGTTIELYHIF